MFSKDHILGLNKPIVINETENSTTLKVYDSRKKEYETITVKPQEADLFILNRDNNIYKNSKKADAIGLISTLGGFILGGVLGRQYGKMKVKNITSIVDDFAKKNFIQNKQVTGILIGTLTGVGIDLFTPKLINRGDKKFQNDFIDSHK